MTKNKQKSRGQEVIKIRVVVVIIGIGNRKTVEKINKTKSWIFGKIEKIDKTLLKLTKK